MSDAGHDEIQASVSIGTRAGVTLAGDVAIPTGATGLVVFAHGSGSSRRSPRNRYVAALLRRQQLATLLLDLLTGEEEQLDTRTGALRFDIGLLADRVVDAIDTAAGHPATAALPIGLFGASTGAAAALVAATQRPRLVDAVVSRGGRPDLAGEALRRVRSPTLLIVGEADTRVIELNEQAAAQLPGEHRLEIVPRSGHLFEEPGALDRVAALAATWFEQHLHYATAS